MAIVYWGADGGGDGVGTVHMAFVRWIRSGTAPPALIVNGGDVYGKGTPQQFEKLLEQMGGRVDEICETPGNHDWETRSTSPATGEIPSGYEAFWKRFAPPNSRQPIDRFKRGGARYEHFVDIAGWRLIFLDTGLSKEAAWPVGDDGRRAWLREAVLGTPGRAKILFSHHSRLSCGKHGDIKNTDALWQTLFDSTGAPRAALTIAGHDHNISVYEPRPRLNPQRNSVPFAEGIYVVVNGAGGRGHDMGWRGTRPDRFFNDDDYCLTRITLLDERAADVDFLSFGPGKDPDPAPTTILYSLPIRL